jgi:hypothetical protein
MATTTRPCSARTLLAQVGPMTLASVGARMIVDLGDGVMFRYGAGRTFTKLLITLAADDTYTVRNVRLAGRYRDEVVELGTIAGVHADELAEVVYRSTLTD